MIALFDTVYAWATLFGAVVTILLGVVTFWDRLEPRLKKIRRRAHHPGDVDGKKEPEEQAAPVSGRRRAIVPKADDDVQQEQPDGKPVQAQTDPRATLAPEQLEMLRLLSCGTGEEDWPEFLRASLHITPGAVSLHLNRLVELGLARESGPGTRFAITRDGLELLNERGELSPPHREGGGAC